jgi:hypothetical protein
MKQDDVISPPFALVMHYLPELLMPTKSIEGLVLAPKKMFCLLKWQ